MSRADKQGYWATPEMEGMIVHRLYRILTHPKALVRGQNLLYDAQYTYRHWHFVPRVAQDTMIAQHSIYCGMRKSLDFQASMYCDHYVYWKDDGKVVDFSVPEHQRWKYNCTDYVRTREVGEVEAEIIKAYARGRRRLPAEGCRARPSVHAARRSDRQEAAGRDG